MTTKNAVEAGERAGLAIGDELSLELTDLLANGQAVGRAGGVVVFVSGPRPGERARVRISAVKSIYTVADLIVIETESPDREQPFCPVFGECGGCQVQHLRYPAQLEWKRRIVVDALERIGGFRGAAVAPAIGMEQPRAYRNKIALVAQPRPGGSVLGFYRARSHSLVPIAGCPVALPQLDAAIGALARATSQPPAQAALAESKHIVARAGLHSKEAVLSLMTPRRSAAVAAAAEALARSVDGVVGVANSWDPPSDNAIVGRRHAVVWGSAVMEETIADLRFRVSAASFFQVNSQMLGAIFATLAQRLEQPRTIVDLYCGMGAFTVFFAKLGCTVTGIEENAAAVNEGRANAALNGVAARTQFLTGRVERVLAEEPGKGALSAAAIAFLDPPRKGTDEATLGAIAAAGTPDVWYLSCNPATLARDLAYLRGRGYLLSTVIPFDMFPHTGHVETLATMTLDPQPA